MRVTVIGWYGTETIGDRAILLGIASILGKAAEKVHFNIGSLFPFYTEKTIREDASFFELVGEKANQFSFSVFNSKHQNALTTSIDESQLVIVGGGPLMHINPMYILSFGFKYAQKKGIKTMVFGCGVGPLHKPKHIKATENLLAHSDFTLFRDEKAEEYLAKIGIARKGDFIGVDPAVLSTLAFKDRYGTKQKVENSYGVICLRAFPSEYSTASISEKVNAFLEEKVAELLTQTEMDLLLLPMHYFHVGGDDRIFLSELKRKLNNPRVRVQEKPLSTMETMECMRDAEFCVGMRFHSVVLETILNPDVHVLDYTEPGIGKISGFMELVGLPTVDNRRYINLQTAEDQTLSIPAPQQEPELTDLRRRAVEMEEKVLGWVKF